MYKNKPLTGLGRGGEVRPVYRAGFRTDRHNVRTAREQVFYAQNRPLIG